MVSIMISYFLHYPHFLDLSESGKIVKLKLISHSAQTLDELKLRLVFTVCFLVL